MEYYLAIERNTLEAVLMRWMNLEPIIRSEVSQKEKENYNYCMLLLLLSRFSRVRLSVIKRNIFESVLTSWMNLEPIIQSEVSQKEKNKYCVLIHIYGI